MPPTAEERTAYAHAYYQANKESAKESARKSRAANPGRNAAYQREAYAKRIGDAREAAGLPRTPPIFPPEVVAERTAKYKAERRKQREYARSYNEANREKMLAAAEAKRRARGAKPRPRLSPEERGPRQPIRTSVRYHVLSVRRCQNCGWSVDDGAHLHVDHIIPVSKGGTNARENLQALCAPCNLGKSDFYEAV